MTEKFQRDAERDAEEDVAKRVFEWPSTPGAGLPMSPYISLYLPISPYISLHLFEWPSTPGAGAIKIIYHYGDDRVTASFRRLGSGLG